MMILIWWDSFFLFVGLIPLMGIMVYDSIFMVDDMSQLIGEVPEAEVVYHLNLVVRNRLQFLKAYFNRFFIRNKYIPFFITKHTKENGNI